MEIFHSSDCMAILNRVNIAVLNRIAFTVTEPLEDDYLAIGCRPVELNERAFYSETCVLAKELVQNQDVA